MLGLKSRCAYGCQPLVFTLLVVIIVASEASLKERMLSSKSFLMRGAVACLTAPVLAGCEPPPPVSLVLFLDSSASFERHREPALQLISDVASNLDPHLDHISAFRVASGVQWLYSSEKTSDKKLKDALTGYLSVDHDDNGTAYGTALEGSVAEAQRAPATPSRTAVLLIGDGADERSLNGRNVDWEKLPRQFQTFPKNARLYFLFISPKAGHRFRETLLPVLGDRLALYTPETSTDGTAKNNIIDYLKNSSQEAK
jgi:hypothetical protein